MKTKKHYYIHSNLIPEGLVEKVDQDKWLDRHLRTLQRLKDKPYLQNDDENLNTDFFTPPHSKE
jgi:hypothetical protein